MLSAPILRGERTQLEPLRVEHTAALASAAGAGRDRFAYTWVPADLSDAKLYVDAALQHQATGRALVHVVRRLSDDVIVGSTRFLDLDVFTWPPPWPPGVGTGPIPSDDQLPSVAEIGSTWYSADAQRTGLNTEVKMLQLTYAFERWDVLRVSLKTDARNVRSRAAIERIGASFEGVRRAHAPAGDGGVRIPLTTPLPTTSGRRFANAFSRVWPPIADRGASAQTRPPCVAGSHMRTGLRHAASSVAFAAS